MYISNSLSASGATAPKKVKNIPGTTYLVQSVYISNSWSASGATAQENPNINLVLYSW